MQLMSKSWKVMSISPTIYIHIYIYMYIPGDSKWPFYPLVGGHSTFGRVTFSPSRKGHQQNCQVYIYIFGRNRGWKRGKWSRNCPWAVLHLDLFDSIDGVSIGLVTYTFDILIQEIVFGHRQHKHPHENTQKKCVVIFGTCMVQKNRLDMAQCSIFSGIDAN